ncbi:amino acid ABC transporter permease [Aestuariivirga sp.]|jgi:general L-amino acid transport system permease protein|uniref:amino acid ABC transporter permease n=1 Tax=Aestuariivirga sp. TaxID=2650926 RepID=UPI003783BC68
MTAQPADVSHRAPPPGAGRWFYDPRVRGWLAQAIVLVLLLWGVYEVVINTQTNLERLNQNFGFDFLDRAAGFDLSTSILSYSSNSSYGKALLVGFWNTALVSVIGIAFATVLGFALGVMRLSRNWVVSRFATVYIEIVRNIPLLLQIFIWYALVLKPLPGPKQAIDLFGSIFVSNRGIITPHPGFGDGSWLAVLLFALALAGTWLFRRWAKARQEATGQRLPVWWISMAVIIIAPLLGLALAGWPVTWSYPELAGFNFKGGMTLVPEFVALLLALSIYTAAFIAENVRSGILAVSHGQTEAAHALGLDRAKTLRLVVIPQAMRVIIPPLANQYLNLTKNSSLAVAIGYPDLMYTGGTVNNQSGKAIEVFSLLLVVYLAISILTSLFMNWFNARIKLVER